MMVLMVSTTVAAFNSTTPQFGVVGAGTQTSHYEPTRWFDLSGFYKILPVAVYANIYHHSIPGLSMPVADKSKLHLIFLCVFAVMMVGYGLIGVSVAYYFGDNVQGMSNLNWHDYLANSGFCSKNCEPDESTNADKNSIKEWTDRASYVLWIVW